MHQSFPTGANRKAKAALAKFQEHFSALPSHLEMDFSDANKQDKYTL